MLTIIKIAKIQNRGNILEPFSNNSKYFITNHTENIYNNDSYCNDIIFKKYLI